LQTERVVRRRTLPALAQRFAANPVEAIADMGARALASPHLGGVLQDEPRRDIADAHDAHQAIDAWRDAALERRRATPGGVPSQAPDGAGQPMALHEFQQEFALFALAMRHRGLPHGQP
jgi:hypothetical protein